MPKAGNVTMEMRLGSSSRHAFMLRLASVSSVVQPWPGGGTYCRSSSQIGQAAGGFSDGAYCVPQVVQMKAGMGWPRCRSLHSVITMPFLLLSIAMVICRYERRAMAHERIELNPEVMGGKPVIRGTRVPVEVVLRKLGAGMTVEAVVADHPRLTADDIRA